MTTTVRPFTTEQQACIARAVELGKNEIKACIAAGRVPPTVATFSELDSHIHTRCLGGLCDSQGEFLQMFPRESDANMETFNQASKAVQIALDEWLSTSIERNALLVVALVEMALNAACSAVQDKLGIEAGDAAGIFFSGEQGEIAEGLLARYARFEIAMMSEQRR